jgi:MFS family permease
MHKNKNFMKLIVGQSIANIGDTIYTIAIISSIYTLTKSAMAISLVPVIITGSMFISGFLTPFVTTRFALDRILSVSQLLKTVVLIIMANYVSFHMGTIQPIILYCLVAVIAFLDGCAEPVSDAMLPSYVQKGELVKANSIFSTVFHAIGIGSWAIGSSLLLIFSITNLLWVDVSLFIISTILMFMLPHVSLNESNQEEEKHSFFEGWITIGTSPMLKTVITMEILEVISQTCWIGAIILVFIKKSFNGGGQWWGYINAACLIGAVIGGLVCLKFMNKIDRNKSRYIFIGALIVAFATLLVDVSPNLVIIVVLSLLSGFAGQIKNIPQNTAVQKHVPGNVLAAVYASMNSMYTGVFSLATLGAGAISQWFGARYVFAISGILMLAVAFIAQKRKHIFQD